MTNRISSAMVSGRQGLARNASQPHSRARRRAAPSSEKPVMAMKRVCAVRGSCFKRLMSSHPSSAGSCKSVSTDVGSDLEGLGERRLAVHGLGHAEPEHDEPFDHPFANGLVIVDHEHERRLAHARRRRLVLRHGIARHVAPACGRRLRRTRRHPPVTRSAAAGPLIVVAVGPGHHARHRDAVQINRSGAWPDRRWPRPRSPGRAPRLPRTSASDATPRSGRPADRKSA